MLPRDSVFVYLATQEDFVSEIEIAIALNSHAPIVRQVLKELGDAVITDGHGNWQIINDAPPSEEIEEECDTPLAWRFAHRFLLQLLENLHNLRQELFINTHKADNDQSKNDLLGKVKEKERQIATVKQKLGFSETDSYQIKMAIAFIRRDEDTQPRAVMDDETISEYAELMSEGVEFPPVTAFYDGEYFYLADGYHRLAAAQKAGFLKFSVEVKHGSKREAILFSLGANSKHGLRRSNNDKRRSVLRLLEDKEWSQWSDRELARRCGVSHDFVNRIRKSHCHLMTVTKLNNKNDTDEMTDSRIDKSHCHLMTVTKLNNKNDIDEATDERIYTTKHGTKGKMKTAQIGKNRKHSRQVKSKAPSAVEQSSNFSETTVEIEPYKEGITYKPGLGCEWNVIVKQETWNRLKEYQAKLGAATLDGTINRLIDLVSDLVDN